MVKARKRISAAGSKARAAHRPHGFTLIELLVVLFIVGITAAAVSLALPDTHQQALNRDAERLAALLESARARSRTTGLPVTWQARPGGFVFRSPDDTHPPATTRWLNADTVPGTRGPITLGPDPILTPQAIPLRNGDAHAQVGTDGLAPFTTGHP